MKAMGKQLSIFDLPHMRRPLPLGYVRDGENLKGGRYPECMYEIRRKP